MKKIGDIMAEMGFRKDAPDSVKEAFIKHLIQSATGVVVETPSEKLEKEKNKNKELSANSPGPAVGDSAQEKPIQLSFDFGQDQGRRQKLPTQKVS